MREKYAEFRYNLDWLFRWIKIIWSYRNTTQDTLFLGILDVFVRARNPNAVHARDYIHWLNTYDTIKYEFSDEEIRITFTEVK